eukprot:750076-Hanusia_phi.AAC.2
MAEANSQSSGQAAPPTMKMMMMMIATTAMLLTAVAVHERGYVTLDELVELAGSKDAMVKTGLVQSGSGLQFVPQSWDVSSSPKDARLADQIAHWSGSKTKFKPATGTQKLAQVDSKVPSKDKLKKEITSAENTLRLSDFLSGVPAAKEEKQIKALDSHMDPKDVTGWKERLPDAQNKKKEAKAVAKIIETRQKKLENELTTTKDLDSDSAKKIRNQLQLLLAKRAALKKMISSQSGSDLPQKIWTSKHIKDGDADDDMISRLARKSDKSSTYAGWLKHAETPHKPTAVKHALHQQNLPRITAGGYLQWGKADSGKQHQESSHAAHHAVKKARTQSLASEDESDKKEAKHPAGKKQKALKKGAADYSDLIKAATVDPATDTWQSIQQRAAYKNIQLCPSESPEDSSYALQKLLLEGFSQSQYSWRNIAPLAHLRRKIS